MHHAYITNNTTAPILNTLSRSSSSNPLSNSTNTSILQNAINSSNSNIVSNRSLNSSSNALSSSLSSLTSSSASAAVANATNSFAGQLALIPTDLDSSTGNLLSSSQNNLNEAGHSVILQGICFEFPAFCCWDDQKNRIVVKRFVSTLDVICITDLIAGRFQTSTVVSQFRPIRLKASRMRTQLCILRMERKKSKRYCYGVFSICPSSRFSALRGILNNHKAEALYHLTIACRHGRDWRASAEEVP